MCLLESGCWKPRLSTGLSPTLLPVRCVIALPAALLANSNPFIFPPVLELWLSEGHKFRTGLLSVNTDEAGLGRAASAWPRPPQPLMRTAGMLLHALTALVRGNRPSYLGLVFTIASRSLQDGWRPFPTPALGLSPHRLLGFLIIFLRLPPITS